MIYSPARYSGVIPQGLHAHLRYLADALPHKASIEISCAGCVIPCQKEHYKTKRSAVSFRFRVSSLGRANLDHLHKQFSKEAYDTRIRRSPKLKLMSQFSLVLPITDTFPIEGTSVFRKICDETGIDWPPDIEIGYAINQTNQELPGELIFDDPFWKAGRSLGKRLNRMVRTIVGS